jgi:hypothetical protein
MFMLIGNPGMLWHPLSGQCIAIRETKTLIRPWSFENYSGEFEKMYLAIRRLFIIRTNQFGLCISFSEEYEMNQVLITTCECDTNMAIFKYDKNKPQRLTFVAEDRQTGKKDEWCLRQWAYSGIHVTSKCDFDPVAKYQDIEPIFHELF